MSMTGDSQDPSWPGTLLPAIEPAPSTGATLAAVCGVLLGSSIIGLLGGFIWNGVAPRAAYVVISRGSADVVNPETTAFIASDATYCLIAGVGGLIIGIAGYQLAVRKFGPAPMAAVLVGSVVAGYVARLVGQNIDLAQFNNQLLTSRPGTILHAPPVLGADASMIMWPAIAVWTLAACIVPAIVLFFATLHGRQSSTQAQLRLSKQLRGGRVFAQLARHVHVSVTSARLAEAPPAATPSRGARRHALMDSVVVAGGGILGLMRG